MNLEEFIHESLVQLVSGVLSAANEVAKVGAYINPANTSGYHPTGFRKVKTAAGDQLVEIVEFDVAVTASQESQQDGKAGIMVASFLGVGGEK